MESSGIYIMTNKTVLDLKDYPDIELDDFIEWFTHKYFKRVTLNNDLNWYKDKYDVQIWFTRDWENKTFSMELKLEDVTDHPEDPYLEEQLNEIKERKNSK